MSDELWFQAADLNAACMRREVDGNDGPLEQLWQASPSFLQSLPFMANDERTSAAKAYLYASRRWLDAATALFPKLTPVDAAELGTYQELASCIARVQGRREMLLRMNYSETLDGVTGAAADLAGEVKRNVDNLKRRGGDMAIGAGIAVAALLLLFVLLR